MKEDLIQFIWRSKMLFSKKLCTTTGESIEILHTGNFNTNQGPDFLFAKIKLNGILWVGHVEIHVKASDWIIHNHQEDPNYQNIILHVVWESDQDINWSGRLIPCIELRELIPSDLMMNYEMLMQNQQLIPCQNFLDRVSPLIKASQIERMMFERMEVKTERCKSELSSLQWDWEAMLYRNIAHYLMAPVNSEAMDQLCQRLPHSMISKLVHDPFQLSAVLFGTAGFLSGEPSDDYQRSLREEFLFLKTKYGIHEMESFEWKLLRMRPSHFPALRMAQLASLVSVHPRLFSILLDTTKLSEVYALFEVQPSDYWNNRYAFGKISSGQKKPSLGQKTKEIIIINAICPLLFAYGAIYQMNRHVDHAINFLQKIKPESNHISRMWKNFNFVFDHAGHSQGGIQLFQEYCAKKKCTSCSIGNEILNCNIFNNSQSQQ